MTRDPLLLVRGSGAWLVRAAVRPPDSAMSTGRRRSPAPTPSSAPHLTLVPATRGAPSPSPSFPRSVSPVRVPAQPSPGPRFTTTSGGRDISVLQDTVARQCLFRQCDRSDRGSISLEELLAGIGEECPELNHPQALRRAFVAANVSRDGLVPRREFRLTLEYALFFRDASDALDRLDRVAASCGDRFSFDKFVDSVHELLPDSDYGEGQLRLQFDLLDKDEQGYVRSVDIWSWAATEHVATKGGDAGRPGSPRVAYVWDGEPLRVAASAKNWHEAVRYHWMASVRLHAPERLPHALRINRAQAAAETESERLRGVQPTADGSGAQEERLAATETAAAASTPAAVSTAAATDLKVAVLPEPDEDSGGFEMPNQERRRESFARMDRNHNGKLSVDDYIAGLDDLWPGLHGEHAASVHRAFAAADTRQMGLLGTREFPRLLEFTLYFYRHRTEFDAVDQEGQGRVNESDFASVCERTGVRLTEAEMKCEFAALDRHDPVNGHYRSGYIQFDQYCWWAAQRCVRAGRKSTEEARMLERSRQRQGRIRPKAPGASVSARSERDSLTPEHHRSGHGSHSRAWERHKGMEGADAFYNLDRSPGQDWQERRHGAAFRR